MKKILSLTLAAITAASVFAGCAQRSPENASPIHAVSSSAETSAKWLRDRLGDSVNGDIFLATSDDADRFGIDISSLRDEGYVIRRNGGDTVILGSTEDGLDRGARYFANYCADQDEIDLTYGEGFRVKRLTIAGRDISEYSIYLFPDADECHTFAAQELRKYIGLACGYYPNIVSEKRDHMIVLERLLDDPTLGEEGFTLSVKDDGNLYITGGKWRGCMYGVYELLERYIGWRFFFNYQTEKYTEANEESFYYLYDSEHVEIPAGLGDTQVPTFPYRYGRFRSSGNHFVKMKESTSVSNTTRYNGYGQSTCLAANHGVGFAAQAGAFSEYTFEKMGDPQPCYTDELFIEEAEAYFVAKVEAMIASGLEIGKEFTAVDVAQPDSSDFCKCKNCMNAIAAERANSAPVLYFTNIMADVMAEKFPGLWVSMLAYWGTSDPPKKTVPRDNVNVSYCFYNDINKLVCGNHSLNGEECSRHAVDGWGTTNYTYAEEFKEWCRISKRVTVWYYPLNWDFKSLTFSTIKTLRDDFKFFSEYGVHGFWICCADPSPWNDGKRESIDILAMYIIQRLLWNADMTDEEYRGMIDDYMYVLYGESGKLIYDYYEWIAASEADGCWPVMACYRSPAGAMNIEKTRDDFELCISMFEDAIKYAPSAKAEYAVRLASCAMYTRGLFASYYDRYLNGSETQKARYTEIWTYFRDLAVDTQYYFAGGYGASVGELKLSDFNIEENPGEMLARLSDSQSVVSEWWKWWEK